MDMPLNTVEQCVLSGGRRFAVRASCMMGVPWFRLWHRDCSGVPTRQDALRQGLSHGAWHTPWRPRGTISNFGCHETSQNSLLPLIVSQAQTQLTGRTEIGLKAALKLLETSSHLPSSWSKFAVSNMTKIFHWTRFAQDRLTCHSDYVIVIIRIEYDFRWLSTTGKSPVKSLPIQNAENFLSIHGF